MKQKRKTVAEAVQKMFDDNIIGTHITIEGDERDHNQQSSSQSSLNPDLSPPAFLKIKDNFSISCKDDILILNVKSKARDKRKSLQHQLHDFGPLIKAKCTETTDEDLKIAKNNTMTNSSVSFQHRGRFIVQQDTLESDQLHSDFITSALPFADTRSLES